MMRKLCSLSCAVFGIASAVTNASKPHIVMFVVDDLGYADVGYHGSDIPTPNIDRLARSGVRLERYYTQAVCSPTRSTWMTGRAVHNTGYYEVLKTGTHAHLPDTPTLAEKLRDEGYKTHMLGKWHLGYDSFNATPTGRGFSSHLGYFQGAEDYYTKEIQGGFDFWDNQRPAHEYVGGYSLTQYMDRTADLIAKHDKSAPFFLYFAHQTIHAPILGLPEPLKTKYEAKCTKSASELRVKYCSMMAYLDDTIEDFKQMLVNAGMWENTLMLFTTDNGGEPFISNYVPDFISSAGCNYPLRSGKGTSFEGGVRGTAFFQGGFLPKAAHGAVRQGLMHTTDVYSTLLSVAGAPPLSNADGVNQWEMIVNGNPSARTSIILNVGQSAGVLGPDTGQAAVIRDEMKYISGLPSILDGYWTCGDQKRYKVPGSGKGQHLLGFGDLLFNLTADPNEKTNVIKEMPEIATQLKQIISEARKIAVPPQTQKVDANAKKCQQYHNNTLMPWVGVDCETLIAV